MNKLTTWLWFDDRAEEAARFYVSVFEDGGAPGRITLYSEAAARAANRPPGSVMTAEFELYGQRFVALNGGPAFRFTEAISLMIECPTQAELDRAWDRLTADGGSAGTCGWLKDKFGLSWQLVPAELRELLGDPDPMKVDRVTRALLQMQKLDLNVLRQARG